MNVVEKLLPINKFSRSGKQLKSVKAVVVHWLENAKQSAHGCWNFFGVDRPTGKFGFGSAHYIVDFDGTILHCIPDNEMAYHVGSDTVDPVSKILYTDTCRKFTLENPNNAMLGIECCHTDWKGNMTAETVEALTELVARLCMLYGLDPMHDVLLHKEVVGWKDCHRYYVNNPLAWQQFKEDVMRLYKVD